MMKTIFADSLRVFVLLMLAGGAPVFGNSNVHITRFWHNHQPIYWPEWNSGSGQDSRVQYAHDSMYGGLGNDDETKPGLAARRAIETLETFMAGRRHLDATGPTVLKPQRFPWNPGGYTFGWFNSVPEADRSFLKQHPSEFYIWTLAHDLSGIESLHLKIRHTLDNEDFRSGHHQNLTYAGGPLVSEWVSIPMTRRVLPNTRAELNSIAGHGETLSRRRIRGNVRGLVSNRRGGSDRPFHTARRQAGRGD